MLSIVTVHKGPLSELKRTIDSIYSRFDSQTEHIVVGRVPDSEIRAVREICKQSRLVINEDKSLYDAMNIGLRQAVGQFVVFINSGDELCEFTLSGELTERTCHLFIPTLGIDGKKIVSSMHGINHQNFIAPNDKEICFEEEYKIFTDAHWMNRMVNKYGVKRCPNRLSIFNYGGLSTRPKLTEAWQNMRVDRYFVARFKLLFKAVFVSLGLEQINKYLLCRYYR